MKNILIKLKSVSIHIWILLAIIILGIFLRTYRFHDWLQLKSDQSRDATLVHKVLTGNSAWPLLGPWVGTTGINGTEVNSFQLGPIYYYFQIISAKIFGDNPEAMAYPDLLFSILSIPLFYLFLTKYFSKNLSVGIAGLYSISFFAVYYSRFAWNPNSIPFFALLFILALYNFIENEKNASWFWTVLLGITLGIGVQLHIITLILFPVVAFFVFIFSLKRNWRIWNKWAVVLAIFLVLNLGQIISEAKTNFSNSRILLNYFSRNNTDDSQQAGLLLTSERNISCHIAANSYMLSSFGPDSCSFYFVQLISKERTEGFLANMKNPLFKLALFFSFIFSFFGYFLLIYTCKKEREASKRYFLRLVILYSVIVFLIMMLAIRENLNFRYFNSVIFIPFVFLGLFIDYFFKNFPRIWKIAALLLFSSFIFFNAMSFIDATKELSTKYKTGYHADFLVQIEPIANFLVAHSEGQKDMLLSGDSSVIHIYAPLAYFLEKQNINLIRKFKGDIISPANIPSFYISVRAPDDIAYEKIGQLYIYRIKK